jgi:hypothetical protein
MLKEFARWAIALGPWGIFLLSLGDSALIPMPQGVDALLIAQAHRGGGRNQMANPARNAPSMMKASATKMVSVKAPGTG